MSGVLGSLPELKQALEEEAAPGAQPGTLHAKIRVSELNAFPRAPVQGCAWSRLPAVHAACSPTCPARLAPLLLLRSTELTKAGGLPRQPGGQVEGSRGAGACGEAAPAQPRPRCRLGMLFSGRQAAWSRACSWLLWLGSEGRSCSLLGPETERMGQCRRVTQRC